jgi:peptidoglycan/LPS O-acetylase OafA/YrhL
VPGPPALQSLTGLRFVAAFAVLGYHFVYYVSGDAQRVLLPIFGRGGAAVGLFFLLSGFVLMWSQPADQPATTAWKRRLARIYPAYLLAWIAASGVLVWMHRPLTAGTGLMTLLLVQAWDPNAGVYWGWNSVAWSLSCEAFFYATFPAIARLLFRAQRRTLVTTAVVAAGLTIAGSVAATAVSPTGPPLDFNLDTVGWLVYVCPLGRLPEFVLGCALAAMMRRGLLPRVSVKLAVVAVTGAYAVAYHLPNLVAQTGLLVLPFAAVIVALAQADLARRPNRWLAGPGMVTLGAWSYSFYLLHGLVLDVAGRAFIRTPISSVPAALGVLVLLAGAATCLACVAFRVVEQPVNTWARSNRAARADWVQVLAGNPSLIQRPIILTADGPAWVARSPEEVEKAVAAEQLP